MMDFQGMIRNLRPFIRKPVFLSEDSTLPDAFRLLYDPPYSVFVVKDARGKLVGVLSEGDMRRHILSGGPLQDQVTQCMQKDPILLRYGDFEDGKSINDIIHRVKRKIGHEIWEQLIIPLVDASGEVLGMTSAAALEMLKNGQGGSCQ